jgi:hypothetical protein
MFSERCIVLYLFNLKFFVQLGTWFAYLICTLLSVAYPVFFSVLQHCYYSVVLFLSVYCTVHCSCIVLCLLVMYVLSACDVRAAILTEIFRVFSSFVRQMPGYNSQRRDTTRTSQTT